MKYVFSFSFFSALAFRLHLLNLLPQISWSFSYLPTYVHKHQQKRIMQPPLSAVKNPLDSVMNTFFNKQRSIKTQSEEDKKKTPSPGLPVRTQEIPTTILRNDITVTSSNKFDMVQRIESVKCAVIGALSGSLAVAPVAFFHHVTTSLPQWELTTDMAAPQGALFAIVYRYAIRNDDNPMLNQGVIGAFVLVRTLPTIQASPDCSALPLTCKSLGTLLALVHCPQN